MTAARPAASAGVVTEAAGGRGIPDPLRAGSEQTGAAADPGLEDARRGSVPGAAAVWSQQAERGTGPAASDTGLSPDGQPQEDACARTRSGSKAKGHVASAPSVPALSGSPQRQTRSDSIVAVGRPSLGKSPAGSDCSTPNRQPMSVAAGTVFTNPVFDEDPARDFGTSGAAGQDNGAENAAAENAGGDVPPLFGKDSDGAELMSGVGSPGESRHQPWSLRWSAMMSNTT